MEKEISRRSFLRLGSTAAMGLAVSPSLLMGQSKKKKNAAPLPMDRKLKILGVGIGGRGASVLRDLETEEIIGLCDVDWKYADHVFKRYPNAKKYNDYRVMYAELLDQADAVVVATADHTHAIIAAEAIAAGKHVYVEKPLTHSVYESRLLTRLAKKYGVATQMGNQGSSGDGVKTVCEWIWNGEIGEVTKVETFTDRPIWPQGLERPKEVMPVPSTLNWDAFIGPAPMRPYNSIYTPWNFRGWWDFGTGALGDMACHILHPVFKALNLKYPTKVQGSSTLLLSESCPNAEMVKYVFPARDNMPKVAMPEVEVIWYDGGLTPFRPEGLPAGVNLNNAGGAAIFYGTKDVLICGSYGRDPYLLSGRVPDVPQTLRRVPDQQHQQDWIRACKEHPSVRVPSESDFAEAGPFNEMVVMGVNAVRLQGLNMELEWDGEKMEFTNIPADATVQSVIHDGFTIHEGHPTFNKDWTEPVNAREFAKELIKHTYHNGYELPPMPEE
jgi:predicted dehydrogenase